MGNKVDAEVMSTASALYKSWTLHAEEMEAKDGGVPGPVPDPGRGRAYHVALVARDYFGEVYNRLLDLWEKKDCKGGRFSGTAASLYAMHDDFRDRYCAALGKKKED